MPITKGPIDDLRREAASRIVDRIREMSVSDAAAKLGVSRQAIYDIRSRKYCPTLALIERACEGLGLEFNFRGLQVGKKTLQGRKKPNTPQPSQVNLFDALVLLENQRLEVVKAKRAGGSVELILRLTIPA